MKRNEIAELSDYKLWTSFYWLAVNATKQANSRRGVTNVTAQLEDWYSDEICKRFGWSKEEFMKEIGVNYE